MERLVERQSVEHDQRLVLLAAADVGEAREAVGRGARQALHGLQRVVAEPRQVLDLVLGEEGLRVGHARGNGVAARRHHHFLERPVAIGGWGAGRGRRRLRRADDGVSVLADPVGAQAVRGEHLVEHLRGRASGRFLSDAQRRRDRLAAVDELQALRAKLTQHGVHALPGVRRAGRVRGRAPQQRRAERGLQQRVSREGGGGTIGRHVRPDLSGAARARLLPGPAQRSVHRSAASTRMRSGLICGCSEVVDSTACTASSGVRPSTVPRSVTLRDCCAASLEA